MTDGKQKKDNRGYRRNQRRNLPVSFKCKIHLVFPIGRNTSRKKMDPKIGDSFLSRSEEFLSQSGRENTNAFFKIVNLRAAGKSINLEKLTSWNNRLSSL